MVTTHITRRLNSVAGKSFNPLGVGAGERRPSCSHYPKPRGMSFNPLGGGAGAWDDPTIRQLRRREESFQSPRRWGGVGLAQPLRHASFNPLGGGAGRADRYSILAGPSASFNPLGGGAGSGSASTDLGSIPLGRADTQAAIALLRFNPLGGGAGSGWSIWQALLNAFLLSFNPLGGGAGSGSCVYGPSDDPRGRHRSGSMAVSIPSEVGRGRAPSTCRRPWSKSRPAGFNPLGGGAGSGCPSGKPCSTPSCLVSIPSEVGRGRALHARRAVDDTQGASVAAD